jgi:nicotinate dehydrogenase subunit A
MTGDHPPEGLPDDATAPEAAGLAVTVNGTEHRVHAGPDVALLHVLRNDLGLKGTLYGCGSGLCGACFVLLDGHPTPSCTTPVWAAAGTTITTVEGLATSGLSPVQQAFVDARAGQCGYCLGGILVTVSSLHSRSDEVTEQELLDALDRHLCRCGDQTRILAAARRALRDEDGS